MNIQRFAENPVVTPEMVPPSRADFEVVCAFNAGVAKYRGEVILLLRVAERPISDSKTVRVPVLDTDGETPRIKVIEFRRDDPSIDFSDSRVVRGKNIFLL